MQHVDMRHVLCGLVAAILVSAQPQFEAASIHRNLDCSGGRGGDGRGGMPVPGRFSVKCFTAQDYIEAAYSMFADGVGQSQTRMRIFGAPPGDISTSSLRLTADRGPVEVLVIDHLEKPSEN
jgi:hypothetical protein